MKRLVLLIMISVLSASVYGANGHQTVQGYILKWKDVAIQQMSLYGIPASITLAQGILESGYGNSPLAVKANNHFGIKCHGWDGETFLKDDDHPNDCFRKYDNAMESFVDHSLFLTSRARYNFLFDLKITDYKAWAKGLKTAGYATNPKYAQTLIHLIEKYKLYQYDTMHNTLLPLLVEKKSTKKTAHKVYVNENKTKYIIAGAHDTFYQLAKEFGLNIRQLEKWNDFPPQKDILDKGDRVYIMRKRKHISKDIVKAAKKNATPLWVVAQQYGVQLDDLTKKIGAQRSSVVAMNEEH